MFSTALFAAVVAAPVSAEQSDGAARAKYILHCSGCHGMNGAGTVEGGIPAFPDSVGHIAATEIGRSYITHVPGVISTEMTDTEIADVLNYILDQWGNGGQYYTGEEVTRRRAENIGDVVEFRRKVVEDLQASGIEIAEYPWP